GHHLSALTGRVEHEAAGSFGATARLLVCNTFELLAADTRAEQPPIAQVDPDAACAVIHHDPAQTSEASLLGLQKIGEDRFPVRPVGGKKARLTPDAYQESGRHANGRDAPSEPVLGSSHGRSPLTGADPAAVTLPRQYRFIPV